MTTAFDQARRHFFEATRLVEQRDFDAALPHARQAVALAERSWKARMTLGDILFRLGQPDLAEEAITAALTLAPDEAGAIEGFASLQNMLGRHELALQHYRRCDQLAPGQCSFNMSLALLALGQWREGFQRYETRLTFKGGSRSFVQPLWTGQPLQGKTLLVHAEQGSGDSIQFARFVPLLRQLGCQIVFEVRPQVRDLLSGVPGVTTIGRAIHPDSPPGMEMVIKGQLPPFDFHIPLLSLGRALGLTPERIPLAKGYLGLVPAVVERWAQILPKGKSLRVGLVWAGSPSNSKDRYRSLALANFAPLLSMRGVRFFSLQTGAAAAEIAALKQGNKITDLAPLLTDYTETAGALSQLDLLISVDTSVAHLAGALGRPVWTLLPAIARDWRWLAEGESTAWYDSMRLFRQSAFGDWGSVVKRLRDHLKVLVKASPPAASP